MEFNAFSASIKRTASVSISADISLILFSASPTPIGPESGFLSNGINLMAVKASRDCVDSNSSEQSFLIKFAKSLRMSLGEFQN